MADVESKNWDAAAEMPVARLLRLGRRLARLLRDRHHRITRRSSGTLLQQVRASIAPPRSAIKHSRITYPSELPITHARTDRRCHSLSVVVIAGDGSGKTTQIPKMSRSRQGSKPKSAARNPTRGRARFRAASPSERFVGPRKSAAKFFDDRSSPHTYIKLTDGILLAGAPTSPSSAIILDEAHERSLNIDFLLGHLKGLWPGAMI
jgi:ATP-dependent helicase HrpA